MPSPRYARASKGQCRPNIHWYMPCILSPENKKAPVFRRIGIVRALAPCKEGCDMLSNSRAYARMPIPKYYTGGSFHLIDGEREYQNKQANDESETRNDHDVPS